MSETDYVLVRYDSRSGIREFSTNRNILYLGSKSLVELSRKSFEEFPDELGARGGYGLNPNELENMYHAIRETVDNSPEILEEIR